MPAPPIPEDRLAEPVVPIHRGEVAEPTVDAVFVHGLTGSPTKTWSRKPKRDFWPAWILEDLPGSRAWLLQYDARLLSWTGSTRSLPKKATTLLHALLRAGVGQAPIVWVGHSLGGLLVKQMLRISFDSPQELRPVLAATSSVLFLGTPHSGANLATVLKRLPLIPESPAIDDLVRFSPHLEDLNQWYRDHAEAHGIQTAVFREDEKLKGVMVVDPASADPGITGVRCVDIAADHQEISKVRSQNDQRYRELLYLARRAASVARTLDSRFAALTVESVVALVGALRALDNEIREVMAPLVFIGGKMEKARREEVIDGIAQLALRSAKIVRIRDEVHHLRRLERDLLERNRELHEAVRPVLGIAEEYLRSLGGPGAPTPFPDQEYLRWYFDEIRQAKGSEALERIRRLAEETIDPARGARLETAEELCRELGDREW